MKHKKLFAILTLVCFLFTLMPVAALAEDGGSGTSKPVTPAVEITPDYSWYGDGSADEFTITTVEQLAGLAKLTQGNVTVDGKTLTKTNFAGKTVKLRADLTFADNQYWYYNDGTTVRDYRIGTFAGNFDGEKAPAVGDTPETTYTISGLKFYNSKVDFNAEMYLFEKITATGSIKNLTLDTVTANINGYDHFGFLAKNLYGTADNCYVKNVTANVAVASNGNGYVSTSGGMFGYIEAATVTNCHATNVNFTCYGQDNTDNVGALIGQANKGTEDNPTIINNCSVADVTYDCTRKTKRTGCFIGSTYGYINISNCTATNVKVYVDTYYQSVSGFVGEASDNSIYENCKVIDFLMDCSSANISGTTGGFAGGAGGSAKFIGCSVTGLDLDLICDNNSFAIGGFIGSQSGTVVVDGCSVSGEITAAGTGQTNPVGGLVGKSSGSLEIKNNSTTDTDITATGAVGGLIGGINGGSSTLKDCASVGSVTSTNGIAGGLVGFIKDGVSVNFGDNCTPATNVSGPISDSVANTNDKNYAINADGSIKSEDADTSQYVCYGKISGYDIGYDSVADAMAAGAYGLTLLEDFDGNITISNKVTKDRLTGDMTFTLYLNGLNFNGTISVEDGTFKVPEGHDESKDSTDISGVKVKIIGDDTGSSIVLKEPVLDHHSFMGWCYGSDGGTTYSNEEKEAGEWKTQANMDADGKTVYHTHWAHSDYDHLDHQFLHYEYIITEGGTLSDTISVTFQPPADDKEHKIENIGSSEYFDVKVDDTDKLTVTLTPRNDIISTLDSDEYVDIIHVMVEDGSVHSITVTLKVNAAPTDEPGDATPSYSSGGGFTGVYNYPVTIDAVDGADVTLSEDNAVAGETVTITVTPNDGKQVDAVIVTDADGNVLDITKVGANEYTFTMPEGKVTIIVTTKTVEYNTTLVLKIDSPYVTVNGTTIKNDAAPIINAEGRTMLPIRVIAEALGADVAWNPELQKVTITKDGTVVEIFIGKYFAYVNGEIVKLDTAAFIKDGRTYLQVRFISEMLDCDVDWDAVTRTVTIRGNK